MLSKNLLPYTGSTVAVQRDGSGPWTHGILIEHDKKTTTAGNIEYTSQKQEKQ